MMGEAELRAMKPTAHYVRASRGPTVDPDAPTGHLLAPPEERTEERTEEKTETR
jgi:hypothetical protein